MSNPFKPGDLIECLKAGAGFTIGETYKVTSATGQRVSIESDDDGSPNGWQASFFRLVTSSSRIIRTELVISAMPEGGFLVTEPSRAAYDMQKHIAAFSRLSDAVGFIEEVMA